MSPVYYPNINADFAHSQPQQPGLTSGDQWAPPVAAVDANLSSIPSYNNTNSDSRLTTPLATNGLPSPSSTYNAQRNNSITFKPAEYPGAGEENPEWHRMRNALNSLVSLKRFLLAAPLQFVDSDIIRQFRLPNDEQISCVRWNQVFCITGTDIVRCILHRFAVFGRDVTNRKKFEEGIFSDLRNLKINVDAILESPKSELLEFRYKKNCVRTKKKQKVFFWYSVHHEQLFIDALERELKKECAYDGLKNLPRARAQSEDTGTQSLASTVAVREPALSFKYDSSIPLSEQIPVILQDLPEPFASLVDETTSAKVPKTPGSNNSSPGDAKSTGRRPVTPTSKQTDLLVHANGQKESYPLTPLQSLDKDLVASRTSFGPQHLEQYGSEKRYETNHEITATSQLLPKDPSEPVATWPLHFPPAMIPSLREDNTYSTLSHQAHMPSLSQELLTKYTTTERLEQEKAADQNEWPGSQVFQLESSAESAWKAAPKKNTDFPLDFLNTRGSGMAHSFSGSLFEAEFTDFAHHNRPALLSETNECPDITRGVDVRTTLLGSPLEISNAMSRGTPSSAATDKPRYISPSNITIQPNPWEQQLPTSENFDGNRESYKDSSRRGNWPEVISSFQFPDKSKPSGGPRGGVQKGSQSGSQSGSSSSSKGKQVRHST